MKNGKKMLFVLASMALTSGLIGCKTKNNPTSLPSSNDSSVSSETTSNDLSSDLITSETSSVDTTSETTSIDVTSNTTSDTTSITTSMSESISDTTTTSESSSDTSSASSSSESITHTFSDWTITTEPTLTTGGVATRHWTDDPTHVETENLPKLTDTSVWSISESVEETNYEDGYTTYTSEYGNVTINSTKKYGNWEFKDSNLTYGGQATLVKKSNVGLEDIEKTVALPNRLVNVDVTTGDFEKYMLEQGKDYYFEEKDGVFTSNNKKQTGTTASMTFTPKVDGTISYTVFCSSEDTYDYFYNSKKPTEHIGNKNGQTESISLELNANETYTFNYLKDNYGGDEGEDQAVISNLKFECLDTSIPNKDDFVIVDYTFNGDILDPMVVVKDSKTSLYDYKKDGYLLDGWYDKTFTNKYNDETTFSDYTVLYAKMSESYKVTLVLNNGEDNLEFHFRKGENANLNEPFMKGHVFVGWYTTSTFEEDSLFNPEVSNQSDVVLYAKWDVAPDYVGEYITKEISNEFSLNVVRYNLVIDERGNISNFGNSQKSGKVISFDKESGRLECEIDGATTFMYYYDGSIIAPISPSTTSFGSEILIGVKNGLSKYGQYSFKDANNKFTTKFIGFVSNEKEYCVGIINDKFYTDLQITSIEKEAIDLTTINSVSYTKLKSFIVKDSSGNTLLAKGKDYNTWVDLEAPYGTYSNNEYTITFNGMGNYSDSNGKTGKYTLVDSENNVVGVTIGYGQNVSEYFEYTLNGDSFTYEKPMVTITFNTGDGHQVIEPLEVNKNVPIVLENAKDEADYIFEGWYVDPACRVKITDKYTPKSNVTIYAKYVDAVKLYVYENIDSTNEPIEKKYIMNEIATVDEPSKVGYNFVGWYTTPTFDEGTEWENGSEITSNTSIYAKYDIAESYVGDYAGVYIRGTTATGGTSTISGNESLTIKSDLTGSFSNKDATFEFDANDRTKLVINQYMTATYIKTFNGWWNESERLLVAISTTTKSSVYLFSGNGETDIVSNVKASYWDSGETRIISYTDAKNKNHVIFIYEGNVYFNVRVLDVSGNEVTDVTSVYSLASTTIVTEKLKFMFVSSDSGLVLEKTEKNINLNGSYGMQELVPGSKGENSLSSEIVVTNGNKITVPGLDLNDTEFNFVGDTNEISISTSSNGYYGAYNENIIVMCKKDFYETQLYDSYIGCKLNKGEDVSKLSTKVHSSGQFFTLNFYAVSFYYDGVLRDSVFCDGTNVYVGVEFVLEGDLKEIGDNGVYKVYYNSKCIFEINNGQMTAVNA